jgi:hypothetical protein
VILAIIKRQTIAQFGCEAKCDKQDSQLGSSRFERVSRQRLKL